MTVLRPILSAAVLFVAVLVYAQEVRNTPGPFEQQATASSPENPIPRRLAAPPAARVPALQNLAGRGVVRLQITLDTTGRVAEIRNLIEPIVQTGIGQTLDEETRRAIALGMLQSAAASVRQWRYDSPSAPITFPVAFNFSPDADPFALQDPQSPRGGGPAPTARGGTPPPGDWPAAQGIPRVGGRIAPPTQTKKVQPVYPQSAQADKVQGIVILEAIIGVDGKVSDVRVLRSVPLLDKAAVDAVSKWEYTPALLEGKPTAVVTTVTVTFTIDGGSPSGPVTAPPWPAAAGALRVGGSIKPPRQTKNVRPVYPVGAQYDRTGGAVILEVLIGPDGKVKDARVLRSSPVFDKSAVEAVKKWEYEPTVVNGVPVSLTMAVTVSFSIR